MQAVRVALVSPTTAWQFLTSPDAGYFERISVASRAGKLFPASWIPKLLAAQTEVANEAEFGIQRHPINAAGRYPEKTPREGMSPPIERTILGHPFVIPDKWSDYPLTGEEMRQSPWPFQVSRALGVLYSAIAADGDPAQIDAVAVTLACETPESAKQVVTLTWHVAIKRKFIANDVFGAWLNVLANPKTQGEALTFVSTLAQASFVSQAKAEALALEALKKGHADVVRQTVFFQRKPYTLILASARFVLSADFRQHYSAQTEANYMNWLRRAMEDHPPDPILDNFMGDDAAYRRVVDDFTQCFKQNEPVLEKLAIAERPAIEQAYREMSIVMACRPR
ncbi:MAG: hypothetical protein LAO21_19570 [Acidobacteriia bacterium]|nr:hypothetical protein [Terriglobia bacterium]